LSLVGARWHHQCDLSAGCILRMVTKWSIIFIIAIVKERDMDRAELLNRITLNPEILVGKPTIRGMRISVEQILDALAAGVPEQELFEDYPALEPDDIRAVLLYAREVVASERIYPIEIPIPA
jgi:uncharacterized protein (DUF433 family)